MIKILKIAIPLLIIAGAVFGYRLYNKPHKSVDDEAVAYQVTASELAGAFNQNEESANEKYLGEILQVNGKVTELILEDESFGLILDGGDEGSVYCAFTDPPQVLVGESVTVKGVCSGYLMDVVMNDCILIGGAQ